MIWIQCLICFGLWIAVGVVGMRRSTRIREWCLAMPRGKRASLGGGLMLGGAAIVLLALFFVWQNNGLADQGLAIWAWILIAVTGAVYAGAQSVATALLVSLAQTAAIESGTVHPSVTPGVPQSSELRQSSEISKNLLEDLS